MKLDCLQCKQFQFVKVQNPLHQLPQQVGSFPVYAEVTGKQVTGVIWILDLKT